MELPSLVVFVAFVGLAAAYPNGAPEFACFHMDPSPGHATRPNISATHPFYVTVVGSTTYTPGRVLNVTACGTIRFKGILLQARTAGDVIVGQFTDIHRDLRKTDCNEAKDNTVTHSNRGGKTCVWALWKAPSSDVGNVYFRATFVQRMKNYYLDVRSDILTNSASAGATPPPTTTTTTTSTTVKPGSAKPPSAGPPKTGPTKATMAPAPGSAPTKPPSASPPRQEPTKATMAPTPGWNPDDGNALEGKSYKRRGPRCDDPMRD